MDRTETLTANVTRYPWYIFFRDCYFWGPAFFLYFTSVLPLSETLWLESVYFVSVAVLEVPSGYLSDRFGRRYTLAVSSACLVLAYLIFWISHSFIAFALAQVFLAAGFASASGTDTALLYESLAGLGRKDDYAKKEGQAMAYSFRAGAIGALAGGLLALGHLRWIYGASFAAALISFFIALAFTDPKRPLASDDSNEKGQRHATMIHQTAALFSLAFSRRLRFFTLYMVFMTILVHFPYEFYQPYLAAVMKHLGVSGAITPGFTGVHLALTMITGSLFTGVAGRIYHRCRIRRALLGAALFQAVILALMAIWIHPLMAVLLVCRNLAKAVYIPLVNAEISPQVAACERSTYLSLQSLMGRLGYGIVLMILSWVTAAVGGGLTMTLAAVGGIGGILWLILRCIEFPSRKGQTCCGNLGKSIGHSHHSRR